MKVAQQFPYRSTISISKSKCQKYPSLAWFAGEDRGEATSRSNAFADPTRLALNGSSCSRRNPAERQGLVEYRERKGPEWSTGAVFKIVVS
jgi:hypothetical protein